MAVEAVTLDTVKKMVQESNRENHEDLREAERIIQKLSREREEDARRAKEDSRKAKEEMDEIRRRFQETERMINENGRQMGYLNNRFGELAEHLVAPNILEKFKGMGFSFEQISQNRKIADSEGNILAETDLLLENGDTAIAVEIKTKANQEDIDDHVHRMDILRRRADKRKDTRKFLGAIASAIMTKEVRNYAHKTGFFVIEQSGDTVKINIPKNFKAREW